MKKKKSKNTQLFISYRTGRKSLVTFTEWSDLGPLLVNIFVNYFHDGVEKNLRVFVNAPA